jgi:hypothetical protein
MIDAYYTEYATACKLGKPEAEKKKLWNRWQDALIKAGKFHTKGKDVVGL